MNDESRKSFHRLAPRVGDRARRGGNAQRRRDKASCRWHALVAKLIADDWTVEMARRATGALGWLGSGLILPRHLHLTCRNSEPFFVIRTECLLGHWEANLRLTAIVVREHVDADWLSGFHQANPCLCAGAGEHSSEHCLRRGMHDRARASASVKSDAKCPRCLALHFWI